MENKTEEVITSTNDGKDVEEVTEDITVLKEKLTKLEGDNRQLFERTKKAEGFEKKGEEWVKVEKKVEKKEKSSKKSEPDEEFGLLEKTYLRTADIVEEDEIELVKKLMEETGKGVEVIDTKYFKSELEELRTTKTNEKATSEVKGGRGGTKATDTPEHWIAKGAPPTPEQVPDRKKRVEIVRAMIKNASTSGKKFYND